MKKIFLILFLLISLLSCKKENMDDCFKPTGDISIEERALEPFNYLIVNDNIDVSIQFSTVPHIRVKAGKNLQESIHTEIKNGTLYIENRNKCNWVRSYKKKIEVELSVPSLRKMEYFGAGNIHFVNQLDTDTFELELWKASGDLFLDIKGQYVSLKSNTGTGTVSCKGETDELILYMGGNGFIDALQIPARKALLVNENTGLLKANVSSQMKVSLNGSGNVEYLGQPSIEFNHLGKGQLINLN